MTEPTLLEAIRDGCRTLQDLAARTGAGTGCGSCRGQLAALAAEGREATAATADSDRGELNSSRSLRLPLRSLKEPHDRPHRRSRTRRPAAAGAVAVHGRVHAAVRRLAHARRARHQDPRRTETHPGAVRLAARRRDPRRVAPAVPLRHLGRPLRRPARDDAHPPAHRDPDASGQPGDELRGAARLRRALRAGRELVHGRASPGTRRGSRTARRGRRSACSGRGTSARRSTKFLAPVLAGDHPGGRASSAARSPAGGGSCRWCTRCCSC